MIVVIGSINTDLVTISTKFPKIGETITGINFLTLPGGKGANQAIACKKLGEDVSFIGCVGNDSFGEISLNNFRKHNIDLNGIEVIDNVASGVAQITVAENDNSIIVVPGANNMVTNEVVDKHISTIENADVVLLQLEIPIETVEYIVDICYEKNIDVILNPAPARKLSDNIINKVKYLTPNETELRFIFDENVENVLKQYPNKIIMTAGSKGVYYHNGSKIINIPTEKVKVVDTTGAGDTFNGALTVGILKKLELSEAIKNANKIASLSVQKVGAQSAMPIDYNSIVKL